MKVITDKELDDTTVQIKCGENYGTAFLINENTAITVKHCLYNDKEKKYETNAVLLVYINNEEIKINVIVDKLFDSRFDELVVLHCEEKINVPTLYLAYADICMFEDLKAIGFGNSYERKKRWIKLQNSNFINNDISENMILDMQNSKAIDYRGFSGALIADTYNYVVGVIKSQLNENGKANALLGISLDKKEFRRLRDMNGGVKELKWLQLEKSTGKTIGDEEICWMVKEGFEPNDLKFVLDQMSICQIRHYLVKQSEKSGDDISHVLQVWNDYLSMAKRLGMDIHDSIIYRTRDLQLRHKEAVLKIEEMKRGIRRRELEEKYVGFQKHLIDLKEKYEFSDGEYQVIAPKSIDDILYEGDTLHHCVNKTDTYFDRIVSKESYILFLREKENPKVPFYTLEVEPDGTIRQKRAEFNRQNKDIDKVTSFLTLWQKEIQKRLTKKDRKSTEESRKLRQQNYQEIRDKHVVVHGGTFAGELLADLLEKDLMDLPVESAENEESPTEIAA